MSWRHITICNVCLRRVCLDITTGQWVHFTIPAGPHPVDPRSKRIPGRVL